MGDDLASRKKSRMSVANMGRKSTSTAKSLVNFYKSLSRMKMRRLSYGFSGAAGIRPIDRSSTVALEYKRPPLIYLPTYQLDPFERFSVPQVEEVINSALDENFTGHKYNVQESPTLALRLAGEIMRNCKYLCFNRYRIIAVVTVGQRRAQSHINAISFLWDHERDNYVEIHRECTTAFIQVIVFGIYLD